jgi:hypothetical protein
MPNLPPVVAHGGTKLGNDNIRAKEHIRMGFWDFEGCEPSKCGALEAFVPLGEWGVCQYSLDFTHFQLF